MVIIRMEDGAHACKPASVVIHHSKSTDAIDIHLGKIEAFLLVGSLSVAGLIGHSRLSRSTEEPVLGKHPVVGIAKRKTEIVVFHIEGHAAVDLHLLPLRQSAGKGLVETLEIQIERIFGISRSRHPRAEKAAG